jgi:ADP-ribosyl-[dinitrogen reductase] hydrolase
MRSAPVGLYFGTCDRIDIDVIRRISAITHRHELAIECCIAYAYIHVALLEGRDANEGIAGAQRHVTDENLLKVLDDPIRHPDDPGKWPGRGAALLTLHVALWSLLSASNFRDSITKCIAIGGDTDTYGAVAGGLLGAKYGRFGIPAQWCNELLGDHVMNSLGTRLWANRFHPDNV